MLSINNMNISYDGIPVVRDFSLNIKEKEIVGIVGESGSGKSTVLKSIMGLMDLDGSVDSGSVIFSEKDILKLTSKELENICGKEISMVFQQPTLHLDPITTIGNQFYEIMKSRSKSKKQINKEVIELLKSLNLSNPERILKSYPFQLSGGISQRVYLALAMANKPKLLLADEPTSALDVTVQVQVVQAMKKLRDNYNTSILIVSHNLGVIANMADVIGIMYFGRLVEVGSRDEIINNPRHEYTKALLKSVPNLSGELPKGIEGKIPDFGTEIKGCPFYSRCKSSHDNCNESFPKLQEITNNHFVYCNNAVMEEENEKIVIECKECV